MEIVIKKHPTIGTNEVFIDGLMVGVFEQMNPDNDTYSFMSKCSHDKLTGDHYISIGQHLNQINNMKDDCENNAVDEVVTLYPSTYNFEKFKNRPELIYKPK